MKGLLAAIVTIFFFYPAIAQQMSYRVRGSVRNAQQEAIPGASVLLTNVRDSSLQKTAVTDDEGKFSMELQPAGVYLLIVTTMGYDRYVSDTIIIDRQHSDITLPGIVLRTGAARTLKGIAVTGRKPLIERQIDRTVVNMDALISSAGSNALELLAKSPGVTVSGNDMIGLNGKDGVLIYIDDRPTYLSGADLTNYLKSLPGATIDKIELITNPPARYDASGNTGVINIRTKKSKIRGFNGNMAAGYTQAVYWETFGALNLNYRNNKVNVFANISYAGIRDYVKNDVSRRYFKADGAADSEVKMDIFTKNVTDVANVKLGLDYYLNRKTTLGINFNGVIRPNSDKKSTDSYVYGPAVQLDSLIHGDLAGNYRWKNGGINLNLQHQYDSTGRMLTADLDYIRYSSGGQQWFRNYIYTPDGALTSRDVLLGDLPGDITIYSAKTDYIHPLTNKARIEGGVKASYVSTDYAAEYFAGTEGDLKPDYGKTNHFLYKENINAAYLNFNQEAERWAIQAGLRVENTRAKGHQLGSVEKPDSAFEKNYTDFFPTAYVSYKLDTLGMSTVTAAYGRRINRPTYYDLNPFLFFRDKFSYRAGNPFLKPQYTDNIELSYKYRSIFSATLLYNRTKGEIRETIEQAGNSFISRNANLGESYQTGLLVNSTLNVSPWWTCNIHAEYQYRKYKSALYNNQTLDADQGTWSGSLFNQFKFNRGWSAELYGMYISQNLAGQFLKEPMGQLDMGVQKMILNDKASIRLNIKDLFRTLKVRGEIINVQQAQVSYRNVFDTRSIGLSFTYRFGKESDAAKRNRKTGSSDSEQQRAGGG